MVERGIYSNTFELEPPETYKIFQVDVDVNSFDTIKKKTGLNLYLNEDHIVLLEKINDQIKSRLESYRLSYSIRNFGKDEYPKLTSKLLVESLNQYLIPKSLLFHGEKFRLYKVSLQQPMRYSTEFVEYLPSFRYDVRFLRDPVTDELFYCLLLDFTVTADIKLTVYEMLRGDVDLTNEFVKIECKRYKCPERYTDCPLKKIGIHHGVFIGVVSPDIAERIDCDMLDAHEYAYIKRLDKEYKINTMLLSIEPNLSNIRKYAKKLGFNIENPYKAIKINIGDVTPDGWGLRADSSRYRWNQIQTFLDLLNDKFEFIGGEEVKLVKEPIPITVGDINEIW